MSGKILDLTKRLFKQLPTTQFVDLSEVEDGARWVQQLYTPDGPVQDRCGIHFGLEGTQSVAIDARQCRQLGLALLAVADHIEAGDV